MRRGPLLAVALALALLGPARPVGAAEPWTAKPFDANPDPERRTAMDVNGSPGAVDLDFLTLRNPGSTPLALTLTPVQARTADGELTYGAPSSPNDAAQWVDVPDAAAGPVEVPPEGTIQVPVVVRFPNTATVGQRLAAVRVAETGTRRSVDVPIRVRTDGEMRSRLVLTESVLAYRRPTSSVTRPGRATYTYVARNTGNTILAGDLIVRLDTVFGRKILLERRDDVVVLPGATVTGEVTAEVWPTFTLTPELGIEQTMVGDDGIESTRVDGDRGIALTVVPIAQIRASAIVGASILGGWLALRLVARRRARRRTLSTLDPAA